VSLIAVRAFGDACLIEQATDGPSTCTDSGGARAWRDARWLCKPLTDSALQNFL